MSSSGSLSESADNAPRNPAVGRSFRRPALYTLNRNRPGVHMDSASELPSRIPEFRNFRCEHYNFCLNVHALRGDPGFDCLGCDYLTSRQEIDPTEGERAALLLSEIYKTRIVIFTRLPLQIIGKMEGRWRQAWSPEGDA